MKNVLFLLVSLVLVSCQHMADLTQAPPVPPPPGPEFKCSHDSIYFVNTVYPLILNGCAKQGCHAQGEEIVLDSYYNIMQLVTPFDPQGSQLYKVLYQSGEEGVMPQDKRFTTEQKSVIYYWIAQGAQNNRCDSAGCDSSNVTYASSIAPIVSTWCLGCHSNTATGGGILLNSYEGVASVASNGKLMGAIRHEYGYQPMPKGGEMLSLCEINLFQKWIILGLPR